ncbi:MAG: type II toxin-antitoxin system VapC family toxin [Euryarchaeota archaeon]|nr:type II toxin-antitoxin system VapC family toxin [Euryarchaeota archaeon]
MAESCLVDSGVWIGGFNPRDRHHPAAAPILRAIGTGKARAVITDHIYGEVVTYLRRKMGARPSLDAARALLDSPHITIVHVDPALFQAAYHLFERYPRLSFADAASVAAMRDRGLRTILSFDSDFDGIQDITRAEGL